jgi:2'-5' RNA ligase
MKSCDGGSGIRIDVTKLERLMQRFGLDPEGRKFTPHVTLARLSDASN